MGLMTLPRRVTRTFALSLVLLPAVAAVSPIEQLFAQGRGPVQRIVQGVVQDKDGAAVKGAVVYLEDTKTNSVKSFIAGENGSYRFVQLTQNTDYSIWAKSEGKKSATKTISSFDTKNELTINLKID